VEDAAIVLRAIAGFDSKDPVSLALPVADCSQGGTPEIHGLKVGVLRELTVRESTEDVEAAVSAAVEVLRDLGASTKDVSVQSEPLARAAMTVIQRVECGVYYSRHMGRQRLAALDSDVKEWLRLTHSYTIDEYLNAQETAAVIRQELLVLLNDVDIIVGPTCPTAALEPTLLTPILTLAPHQHGTGSITVRGSRVNAKALATRGTVLGSLANLPCLSVPCGFSSESLPIGLQLMGPPLNEGVLLRVGMAYQAATDWHLRQPVLLDP
jgi:Asp-tRNA(Asn)/Glu-tRNA(Gln) amidotransferase A subunit family amidase